jgi:dipeptidyl-peptidase-4
MGAMLRPPAARVLIIGLAAVLTSGASGAKKPVTIDAVVNAPSTSHGRITWAPDGTRFVIVERGTLSLYDVKTGKERAIVEMANLDRAAVPVPAPMLFDWTNRRVDETSIQWFADGKRLLVAAAGDLFLVDIAKNRYDALTQTSDAERDAKLSPDGRYVSFRRGPDLYTMEIESKFVYRLTANGSDTLLNGQLDWVYPEELGLGTAHWWSPDGKYIAYLQLDISREPVYPQVSLLNARGVPEPERYPQPGDPNPDVRLGVVPAAGGPTRWMDLGDPRDNLLARVVWSPNSREIMAERLNRVQNQLDLLLAEVSTGASRVILHEEDPQWINVRGEPHFLGSGDRFLWASERSGFRHIYLYANDGKLLKQLTSGEWEVDRIAGVDEAAGRVFFTSTEESPAERQLYSVALDGSGKQRLTEGAGTHNPDFAPKTSYFLDDFTSLATPQRSRLYKPDGGGLREYHAASKALDEYDILPAEIVTVKSSDGTVLYARLIRPAGFEAGKKYPAVVNVYGGPGAQQVRNAWQPPGWEQVLAHKGFVVWELDNRGSAGRGHKFESAIYHNMGAAELRDQKEGIDYLISMGFVDRARIGMYGWSYGGFMTLYTITHAPGLIKAAIAGAPVVNWRNYDSIYTERYMGLPEENEEGYRVSSPANAASAISGTKLLILHNLEDDNVHFQNSLQMAEALEKAGKRFYMVVYPQKTHSVAGPEYRQLLEETTAFFEENLK